MDLTNMLVILPMHGPTATAKIIPNVAIKSHSAAENPFNPSSIEQEVIVGEVYAVYPPAPAAENALPQQVL